METTIGKAQRWSKEEVTVLVNLVTENINIIKGKFTSSLTSVDKQRCWEKITESVNACSVQLRSVSQVKKKWLDLQGEARKKEATRKREAGKTGGGPPPETVITNNEEKILSVVSDVTVSGVVGGFDSFVSQKSENLQVKNVPPTKLQDLEIQVADDVPSTSAALPFKGKPSKNQITRVTADGPSCTCTNNSLQKISVSSVLEVEKIKIQFMKERNELERRKVEALEELVALKRRKMDNTDSDFSISVSPIIKFAD